MMKTIKDWEDHKKSIMKDLAKLQSMNWAADEKVAHSVFPYVLIEALNLLKNSNFNSSKLIDYAKTGEEARKMLNEIQKESL